MSHLVTGLVTMEGYEPLSYWAGYYSHIGRPFYTGCLSIRDIVLWIRLGLGNIQRRLGAFT